MGRSDIRTDSSHLASVLAIVMRINVKNNSPRILSISNKNLTKSLDFSGNSGVLTNSFPVPERKAL